MVFIYLHYNVFSTVKLNSFWNFAEEVDVFDSFIFTTTPHNQHIDYIHLIFFYFMMMSTHNLNISIIIPWEWVIVFYFADFSSFFFNLPLYYDIWQYIDIYTFLICFSAMMIISCDHTTLSFLLSS